MNGCGRSSRDAIIAQAAAIGLDCSDEAQQRRQELLENLEAQLFAGVTSVSDRGRSVSYADATKLIPLIAKIRDELTFCELGYVPARGRRWLAPPLIVKGL